MTTSDAPVPEWPESQHRHHARIRQQLEHVVGPHTEETQRSAAAYAAAPARSTAGISHGATVHDWYDGSRQGPDPPEERARAHASSEADHPSAQIEPARFDAQRRQPTTLAQTRESESSLRERVRRGDIDALDELLSRPELGYEARRFPDEGALVVAIWKAEGPTFLLPREKDDSQDSDVMLTQGRQYKLAPFFTYERDARLQTCVRAAEYPELLPWGDWRNDKDPEHLVRSGLKRGELRRKED